MSDARGVTFLRLDRCTVVPASPSTLRSQPAAAACEDGLTTMDGIGQLYRAHAGDLLRFARSLTGDASLAEDAVAEAFVRVLAGPPIPAGVAGRPWLFGVTRHVCLDLHRSRSGLAPEREAIDAPDHAPGPEVFAASRDALHEALGDGAALPEERRSALLLRAQEGMSHEEIGDALGITAGAARVRVHRARAALARLRKEREGKSWK